MELARESHLRVRASRFAIRIQLPVYVRLTLSLLLGILVLVIGVMLLGHWTQPSPNPFSAYTNLLPSQMATDLEQWGFTCAEQNSMKLQPQPYTSALCAYRPATGTFEQITVFLSPDHTVKLTTFTVRQDALHVGDLALVWGRPPIIVSTREWMTLDWPSPEWSVLANTKQRRFSYLAPLHRVTFIAAS